MLEAKAHITPQQQIPTIPQPCFHYTPRPLEAEINPANLWAILVKQRVTILAITVLSAILALIYALQTPSVYKAESIMLPPTTHEIEKFNISGINFITAEDVFRILRSNISSLHYRRAVFDQMNLMERLSSDSNTTDDRTPAPLFYAFNKKFDVPEGKDISDGNNLSITLTLEGEDPILTANIINRVVEVAGQATSDQINKDIHIKINAKINILQRDIQQLRISASKQKSDRIKRLKDSDLLERNSITDEIKALRVEAATKRGDRIIQLTEAAHIASEVGIIDSDIEYNSSSMPLYVRGEKALRSEIRQLEARTSDDPFIPELRELQKKLKQLETNRTIEMLEARQDNDSYNASLRRKESELIRLRSTHIEQSKVAVMRIDQPAFPPDNPIEPNRRFILALGIVLGLILGILLAFIRDFIKNQKTETVSSLRVPTSPQS